MSIFKQKLIQTLCLTDEQMKVLEREMKREFYRIERIREVCEHHAKVADRIAEAENYGIRDQAFLNKNGRAALREITRLVKRL